LNVIRGNRKGGRRPSGERRRGLERYAASKRDALKELSIDKKKERNIERKEGEDRRSTLPGGRPGEQKGAADPRANDQRSKDIEKKKGRCRLSPSEGIAHLKRRGRSHRRLIVARVVVNVNETLQPLATVTRQKTDERRKGEDGQQPEKRKEICAKRRKTHLGEKERDDQLAPR